MVSSPDPLQAPTVKAFFDTLTRESYDASILKACPPYGDIMEALMDHIDLPRDARLSILDLGCGTGLLTALMARNFPNATFTVVDMSGEMIAATTDRMAAFPHTVTAIESDIRELRLPENHFDLALAGFSLHHLDDPDKWQTYRSLFGWLKPGGLFRCNDQCLTQPQSLQAHETALWVAMARAQGATDQDLAMWQDHALRYDHYACLADHLRELEAAGFEHVDCYWKQLYWTVFGGQKPENPKP